MNSERLQLKGLLADLRRRQDILNAEGSGQVLLIRHIANPHQDDLLKIDIEKGVAAMLRLRAIIADLGKIREKITHLVDGEELN
jgi:hypothetical protein